MVRMVSPNCVKETPKSSNWSCVIWLARKFAIAVSDAVNSQAFIISPSASFYGFVANMVSCLF